MSAKFFRYHYIHRFARPRRKAADEHGTCIDEKVYMIRLGRSRASSMLFSYDNDIGETAKPIASKWAIVRQRLPDILALSLTYKPFNTQTQLLLLVRSIDRQTKDSAQENDHNPRYNLSDIPSNVVMNIAGRRRLICLKRIPIDQVIHVDIGYLSISIPTRQFILAISRGDAHQTAARYCPPAISDHLINLSQTKVIDDGRQYKRALYKTRVGQILFLVIVFSLSGMMLALVVSTVNTLFKLNSLPHEYEELLR